MTALINADTSSGVVVTSDTSGNLALQSAGTTKLTVSSAGVAITTGTVTTLIAPTSTITTLNAPSGVLATQNGMTGIAKAWVQFAGSTGTINGSFNVSSITVNTTGDYTVNFTNAMPNTNYATVGTCALSNAVVAGNTERGFTPQDYNTTSIRYVVTDGASGVDPLYCNVVVFSS